MPNDPIIDVVISIYGWDTGFPPIRRKVTGVFAYGAHISKDETYWEDTVAASSISPPMNPLDAVTSMGKLCSFSTYLISTPLACSDSTRGPIGLTFIRAFPVSTVDVTVDGLHR